LRTVIFSVGIMIMTVFINHFLSVFRNFFYKNVWVAGCRVCRYAAATWRLN
jgi:hypothetical protein